MPAIFGYVGAFVSLGLCLLLSDMSVLLYIFGPMPAIFGYVGAFVCLWAYACYFRVFSFLQNIGDGWTNCGITGSRTNQERGFPRFFSQHARWTKYQSLSEVPTQFYRQYSFRGLPVSSKKMGFCYSFWIILPVKTRVHVSKFKLYFSRSIKRKSDDDNRIRE